MSETAKEPTASNLCCKEGSLIHIARIKKIDNYAIATAIAPQTLSAVLRSVPRKGKLKSRTQTTQNSLNVHLPMLIYLHDSDYTKSSTGATNKTIK